MVTNLMFAGIFFLLPPMGHYWYMSAFFLFVGVLAEVSERCGSRE